MRNQISGTVDTKGATSGASQAASGAASGSNSPSASGEADNSEQPADQREPILIYNHIPKCGGNTLIHIFREVYGAGYVRIPTPNDLDDYSPEQLAAIKAISSHHTGYGLHEKFPNRRPIQICIVREPLERFVSRYNYSTTVTTNAWYKDTSHLDPTEFLEFLRTPPRSRRHYNIQCHLISKISRFEQAKEFIDKNYEIVAPIEMFDLFVQSLARYIDLPLKAKVSAKNVSEKKISVRDLSWDFKLEIYKDFQDDLKLYHYVKERFLKRFV
ncbi:MAG: sulfotransferase family protein [Alphaproteobacteria bacterium]|nr:sulfotransferase family protein [Alphaproteobacteria bacterium]